MPITLKRIPILIKKFGGNKSEGIYTKIITDENKQDYEELLHYLETDETPLIVCRFTLSDWTLLTTERIPSMNSEDLRIMNLAELVYSNIDMPAEIASGARSLADFSKIVLRDVNNKTFTITIEKRYPFGGFLQVLTSIRGYFPKEK